jgi:hypothetical protein
MKSQQMGTKSFQGVANSNKTLKNENCIHEKTTSGLSSGNACYHLVKNLLSSGYLPKIIKIKIQGLQFGCCSFWVYNLVSDLKVLPTTEQNVDLPRRRWWLPLKHATFVVTF